VYVLAIKKLIELANKNQNITLDEKVKETFKFCTDLVTNLCAETKDEDAKALLKWWNELTEFLKNNPKQK